MVNLCKRRRNRIKYLSISIKITWLLSVSGLVWIMACVRARLFANGTYKARQGLPALYVQEHAFRDLYT